jgi:hypothetical protein
MDDRDINYIPLSVADGEALTLRDVQKVWRMPQWRNALILGGNDDGQLGTLVTALQMFSENHMNRTVQWTHQQYLERNRVAETVQVDTLDLLQEVLNTNSLGSPLDQDSLRRLRLGEFERLDCQAVLLSALGLELPWFGPKTGAPSPEKRRQIGTLGEAFQSKQALSCKCK